MRQRSEDLGGHAANAGTGQADFTRRGGRKVENTAMDEGAPVIDGNDHAAAAVGDPELGAERQRAMGAGQGVLIEALSRGGPAAGFIAVIGGHSGEGAPSARRSDRGVGVAPGSTAGITGRVAGVVGMAMAVVVMSMRSGRGFGDAPTDHESCGEYGERRTRLGCFSQPWIFPS